MSSKSDTFPPKKLSGEFEQTNFVLNATEKIQTSKKIIIIFDFTLAIKFSSFEHRTSPKILPAFHNNPHYEATQSVWKNVQSHILLQ